MLNTLSIPIVSTIVEYRCCLASSEALAFSRVFIFDDARDHMTESSLPLLLLNLE